MAIDNDDSLIEEASTYVEDIKDVEDITEENFNSIVSHVEAHFTKAKTYRNVEERRWLRAYRNYRGLYGPDVMFTETEKSRVFIKVTKTKTLAAYGQIVDVLFGNQTFPIIIDPTILPEGVSGSVHFDPALPDEMRKEGEEDADVPEDSPYGFAGDGKDLKPGATERTLSLGALEKKLGDIDGVKEGQGVTPTSVTFYPAQVAAKKMQKKILNQLEECHASKHLRSTAFEMSLFGTGILKGPFAVNKEFPDWDLEGNYNPLIKTVPQVSHVSIWNLYPDPDASNMEEAEYVIERHKLSRSQLRALKKRPFFRGNVIEASIKQGESYVKQWWEDDLADYEQQHSIERFEVLEYWGVVDAEFLEEEDIDIPKELQNVDQIQINAWIVNNNVIRLVLNPFKPVRIPYMAAPYELNPYSFFGVGIAENMDDTQTLMNGFMRMAVDNAVLSGNLLIEVDETNLVPGQDMSVYPGKVFRRQGGAPGQSIFGTSFPNVAGENLQLFDKARQLADDSTGFPSFAHGQTGVTGIGRTASGISMLMGAAAGGIKNVIKNVDDYLLKPLGDNMFHFNMQFDHDPEIKGNLEVKARGTESLMANEVRSQRLMQFLSVASNPALAPYPKFGYIITEIARTMGLDPEKVINSAEEAAVQAELLKKYQADQPQPEQPPAGANPADMTGAGDGTIGTGIAPGPEEQGFTGNEQQQQEQQPAAGGAPPGAGGPPPVA
jgi:hypothetical protein|tara:strand:+ start:4524 stop:6683 length:2160 start_codon:yes stop_codon:yes gene_type:complete